ncbi:MAG: hypothetical protein IJG84_11720 [Kiritimatiellae bacterium]|nr:hypothetical protein [Kiritimatiellia bacterium]
MTTSDLNDEKSMIAEAEAKGKELEELEARNRLRRAKGRKPLPDPQEREDQKVWRKKYRTGDSTTVSGADAIKLFEMRKAQMDPDDDLDDDGLPEEPARPAPRSGSGSSVKQTSRSGTQKQTNEEDEATEKAIREAEAARRVQDLKNGRIDHEGNWSDEGQKLEGGDSTKLVDTSEVSKAWGLEPEPAKDPAQAKEKPQEAVQEHEKQSDAASLSFESFKNDLYKRLGTSFQAVERTLSDLQGRVSEIVTASAKNAAPSPDEKDAESEFEELLSRKTPVVFDVGGTQMTFDAITVFYARPCITLVSKIGSAKITPKPGARLLLTYDMDGRRYENDPVVFLGTRFDLPMFGLSFVGFIREADADMLDAAAGVQEPAAGVPSDD